MFTTYEMEESLIPKLCIEWCQYFINGLAYIPKLEIRTKILIVVVT